MADETLVVQNNTVRVVVAPNQYSLAVGAEPKTVVVGSDKPALHIVEGTTLNVTLGWASGPTGPDGPNFITSNTATSLTGFLYGNGSTVLARTPWIHLVGEASTNGVSVALTGGSYLIYNYNGATIYRFISTASDANGYPTEDAFYTTLSGGALSGKICQRNL